MKASLCLSASVVLLTASLAYGSVVIQTGLTAAQFAAFQAGKTVQNFESVSGVPGFNITNFN